MGEGEAFTFKSLSLARSEVSGLMVTFAANNMKYMNINNTFRKIRNNLINAAFLLVAIRPVTESIEWLSIANLAVALGFCVLYVIYSWKEYKTIGNGLFENRYGDITDNFQFMIICLVGTIVRYGMNQETPWFWLGLLVLTTIAFVVSLCKSSDDDE